MVGSAVVVGSTVSFSVSTCSSEVSYLQIYLKIDIDGAFFGEGILARIRVKNWFLRRLRRPARKAMWVPLTGNECHKKDQEKLSWYFR